MDDPAAVNAAYAALHPTHSAFHDIVYDKKRGVVIEPEKAYNSDSNEEINYDLFSASVRSFNHTLTKDKQYELKDHLASGNCKMLHDIRYMPDCPEMMKESRIPGYYILNTYRAPKFETATSFELVDEFIQHIHRVCNQSDAHVDYLLQFFKHTIHFPHLRFPHAVLITGMGGIGKTVVGEALRQTVGLRNASRQNMDSLFDMSSHFNAFLGQKTLITVEEAYSPSGKDRRAFYNGRLREIITEGATRVEKKGVDSKDAEICCNFLLFSNHRDAIPITEEDRRIYIIHSEYMDKKEARASVQQFYQPNTKNTIRAQLLSELYTYTRDKVEYIPPYSIELPKTQDRIDSITSSSPVVEAAHRVMSKILASTTPVRCVTGTYVYAAVINCLEELGELDSLPPYYFKQVRKGLGIDQMLSPTLQPGAKKEIHEVFHNNNIKRTPNQERVRHKNRLEYVFLIDPDLNDSNRIQDALRALEMTEFNQDFELNPGKPASVKRVTMPGENDIAIVNPQPMSSYLGPVFDKKDKQDG